MATKARKTAKTAKTPKHDGEIAPTENAVQVGDGDGDVGGVKAQAQAQQVEDGHKVCVEVEVCAPVKTRAPRRAKGSKKDEVKEHIIVQLPNISQTKLDDITHTHDCGEGSKCEDPSPYAPGDGDHFSNHHDPVEPINNASNNHDIETSKQHACFWCCHPTNVYKYGMPISYDCIHKSFNMFGNFCSLECAGAYNFSTHMGSDRVWEIHGWIQLMAKKLGIETPIRLAPSKYLLQMFGGPMKIDEFRRCHKSLFRAYVMNIPPMINVNSQHESVNVSYILNGSDAHRQEEDRKHENKLARSKSVMDSKRTLDSKMNLTYESVSDSCTKK